MKHEMKLNDSPFNKIKNGTKTMELRLYDEKRRRLREKDYIEFTNILNGDKLTIQIEALYKFKDFVELYKEIDKCQMGYENDDIADPNDMEKYYSLYEQEKYGVLAIKMRNVN